jgi:hypothetical protein
VSQDASIKVPGRKSVPGFFNFSKEDTNEIAGWRDKYRKCTGRHGLDGAAFAYPGVEDMTSDALAGALQHGDAGTIKGLEQWIGVPG